MPNIAKDKDQSPILDKKDNRRTVADEEAAAEKEAMKSAADLGDERGDNDGAAEEEAMRPIRAFAPVAVVDLGARWALLVLVMGYQKWISPLLANRCRFYPSCSEYARIALRRFSAPRAVGLIVWRLARCHPLCQGGNDPPPQ